MVSIRPYTLGDAEELCAAALESSREVHPWMPWCHPGYRLSDASGWLPAQAHQWASGEGFQFAIRSNGGEYLGGCGINNFNREHGFANLGYWVRSSATGRGLAAEAVRLLRDWTFAQTDLVRLELVMAVENARSARVAEKAGAHFEGVLQSRLRLHHRMHDARLYSLTR
jgi:RimJ/RimL family protein N-acetyltransferase